nr:uncharacterized protein LOC114826478 isoform X3 [Malus domestica]XP_028962625.1 uncharacterized protein LOC114826478 isoform X4 [Malus domestica]
MTIITAKLVSVYRNDSLITQPSHTQKTKLVFSIAFKIRHGKVFPGKSSHDSRENTQNQSHGSLDQAIHLHGVHRLRPRATFLRLIDARSFLVVLGEVCEGPMGQGGLRFRVAEIQGLPRRTFGR